MTAMPNCCGASIIYNFPLGTTATDSTFREMVQKIQGIDDSGKSRPTGNQMVVCTLNDSQCKTNPKMLEILAGLGFVLAGRTNNGQHNSWVNLFVRCEMRGVKYVKPPFEYPGTSTLTQFEHPKPMARMPKDPGKLPNPFKPDGGIEFNYVHIEVKA
jgi:hypothetical protein